MTNMADRLLGGIFVDFRHLELNPNHNCCLDDLQGRNFIYI